MAEDLHQALAKFEGAPGARALRRALRELPLDGGMALAICERLTQLEAR